MRRLVRIVGLGLLLWGTVGVAQTTGYIGLPFEPKPADCYEQARWNGRTFIATGQTICLLD